MHNSLLEIFINTRQLLSANKTQYFSIQYFFVLISKSWNKDCPEIGNAQKEHAEQCYQL